MLLLGVSRSRRSTHAWVMFDAHELLLLHHGNVMGRLKMLMLLLLLLCRSVAWVLNGWYLFLPSGNATLDYMMASITAVVGGTLFWIGAYLSIVEAVNTDQKVRL